MPPPCAWIGLPEVSLQVVPGMIATSAACAIPGTRLIAMVTTTATAALSSWTGTDRVRPLCGFMSTSLSRESVIIDYRSISKIANLPRCEQRPRLGVGGYVPARSDDRRADRGIMHQPRRG